MNETQTIRAQIDSICNEFELGWSKDRPPDFERWLQRIPPANRQQLAKELLAVHLELLLDAGGDPVPSEFEYLGAEAIEFAANVVTRLRRAAHDHTITFNELHVRQIAESPTETLATRSMPPEDNTSAPEIPDKLGDFQIIRKIGQGGMGAVFEAEHVQRGTRVALKTLPEVSAQTLYLFKREFRTLAKISHRNLVGLHRLESDGESWFFTMDLIHGTDFRSYVRPDGVLDSKRLESAYQQLVEAVSELHSRKILHRDLKPSNVMVDESGTLKVLDFGLVFDLANEQELKPNSICGTPAYMSPEQISGSALTPASDWFSVGVMLYEAMGGKLPWQGNIKQLMYAKLNFDPPHLDVQTDSPLAGIAYQLLDRDPTLRLDPSTGSIDQLPKNRPSKNNEAFSSIQLLGRESQLAALQQAYQAFTDSGEPTVVFVSGRSGEGKTHLTEQFIDSIRDDPISILSGRCYDRESVPYKAVDHLIESLAAFLGQKTERELSKLLPQDAGILAQVFPAFLRLPEVATVARNTVIPQDGREVRKRAFLALRELVQAISSEKPILLFLDDMQWGDAESAELIREIIRLPHAPQVLLLMTYRSDEAETSAFLNHWKTSGEGNLTEHVIEIGPLGDSEIERLVDRYIGRENSNYFDRVLCIARETAGNPFLLVEFLESLEGAGDEVKVKPLAEVISRKLDSLPAEAKTILEFFAISGQAIELEDIADAYGAEQLPMDTIYRMRNENLLRQIGQDDALQFDTYHDKVRETLLSEFDANYKVQLHNRMAQVIEEKIGGFPIDVFTQRLQQKNKTFDEEIQLETVPRVYDLSYHYDAAEESELAAKYAYVAAFQAKSQFSLEVAVAQFSIFLRNSQSLSEEIKYQAGEAFGLCLLRSGQFKQSDQQLQETLEFAGNEIERARLRSLQAEICLETAEFSRGKQIAEQQLRALKVFVPKGKLIRIVHGLMTVGWHLFYVQYFEKPARHNRAVSETDYVIYELFRKLIYLTFYINSSLHIATLCRSGQLISRWNYNWSVADFEGIAAGTYSGLGLTTVGQRKNLRAREFFEGSNDSRGVGNVKFGQSLVKLLAGEFDEHAVISTESDKLLGQTGDLWRLHANRCMTMLANGKRGEITDAVRVAKQTIRSQLQRGSAAYALDGVNLWVIVTQGNAPFQDLANLCQVGIDDGLRQGIAAHAQIHWHLFHGRYRQALKVAQDSVELAKLSRCLTLFTVSLYPAFVKASCALVNSEPQMDSRERKRILKAAMKKSKKGLIQTKTFRFDRAWALREHAELLLLLGKLSKAETIAWQSCELAEAQGAKVDLMYSRETHARIRQELGRSDGDKHFLHAKQKIEEFQRYISEANNDAMKFIDSMRQFAS